MVSEERPVKVRAKRTFKPERLALVLGLVNLALNLYGLLR
jgi:hypothetical protein